jgi:hypothetical protein
VQGTRVVGRGGGAVYMVAIGCKAAADVRTGHITNHPTGDQSYRSTEKRPGSGPKGHVVHPLSSVSRSRQENGGGDDCHGKQIFHDRTPRCGRGPDQVQVPLRRAHTLNVEVAEEFQSNQKLFSRLPTTSSAPSGRAAARWALAELETNQRQLQAGGHREGEGPQRLRTGPQRAPRTVDHKHRPLAPNRCKDFWSELVPRGGVALKRLRTFEQ